jgi:hypothetical protein
MMGRGATSEGVPFDPRGPTLRMPPPQKLIYELDQLVVLQNGVDLHHPSLPQKLSVVGGIIE